MEFVKWVDEQSLLIKLLLFFPIWGWIFGFLYRLLKFLSDTSKTINLVGAILFLLGPIGAILEIVDFIFVILNGKPTFLVE